MSALILHIGFPKTGSSTIQRLLGREAARLGIGFSFDAGSALVDFAVTGDARPVEARLAPLCAFPLAVISNETVGSHVRRAPQAAAIVDLLGRSFADVRVICYLRRQDEAAVSAYSTTLLSGATGRFDPERLAWPWHAQQRLRIWAKAAGRERLVVRRFGAAYFEGGDLVGDFTAASGIPLGEAIAAGPVNVSPSVEALELMRLVNIALADHPRRREVAKRIFVAAPPGRRLGLSRAARQALMERYEVTNGLLAREYFGTDDLFTHPFADDAVEEVALSPGQILALAAACGGTGLPTSCACVDAAVSAAARSLLAAGERRAG